MEGLTDVKSEIVIYQKFMLPAKKINTYTDLAMYEIILGVLLAKIRLKSHARVFSFWL